MTGRQLIEDFFSNPIYNAREYRVFGRLFLHHIANHVYEAQLENGQLLGDGDISNVPRFLKEIAEIAAAGINRIHVDRTCPDCRHVHTDRNKCNYYLGEGKFCRCESTVPA